MGGFHLEGPRREVLEVLHRPLQSRAPALVRVYTHQVRAEGVGKMSNSKQRYRNIMSRSRDSWRPHSETRREIHDQTERETSYYAYPLFNFKSLVPMFSTSFCGDNKLRGDQMEMDHLLRRPQHISSQSRTFTKSGIKPDKSSLHCPLPDFEISQRMSSTN